MRKRAKLTSMHIDNCFVALGELYMILTVHSSDHKKSKCIINEYRRDRQMG